METILIPLYIVFFAALLVSYIGTAFEMAEGDYTRKRELLFDLLPFGMPIRKFLKLYNTLED